MLFSGPLCSHWLSMARWHGQEELAIRAEPLPPRNDAKLCAWGIDDRDLGITGAQFLTQEVHGLVQGAAILIAACR
jgi:hypothetical protein